MEQITAIIPTLNNRPSLLNEVLKVLLEADIYLKDIYLLNTSKSNISGVGNKHKIRVITEPNLLKAKNKALNSIKSKLLLLLDDDVVFTKKQLESFLLIAEKQNFEACSPYVFTNRFYKRPDFINKVPYGKFSLYKLPSLNERKPPNKDVFKADFLPGCFCLYKVSALKNAGGWDNNYLFPFYNEDTDVSIKIARNGGKLLILSNIKVLHKKAYGGVRTTFHKSKWFYNFGFNNSYYYFKNFGFLYYLFYLIFRFRDSFYVLKQFRVKIYLNYLQGIYAGYKKASNKRFNS